MSKKFRYNWGQDVYIIDSAPAEFRPGKVGSVCGMRLLGKTRLYIIEFSDGHDVEIPEEFLSGGFS